MGGGGTLSFSSHQKTCKSIHVVNVYKLLVRVNVPLLVYYSNNKKRVIVAR